MGSPGMLRQKLQLLQGKQFTGRVDIKQANGGEWRIYFCLSRLIWADGGSHPYRAWHRLLNKYCPNLDHALIDFDKAQQFECWNYYIIVTLLQRFLITKNQALQLINSRISEIIFDIYQAEIEEKLDYDFIEIKGNFLDSSGLRTSVALLKTETFLDKISRKWQKWQKYGLQNWSPSLAPIIKNPVLLRKKLKETTYKKLISLFNGKYPLRELGEKMQLDLLKLTRWLKPYLEEGLIELITVGDIPLKIDLIGVTNTDYKITKTTHQKLIACIDDSLQICQIMEHIVTKAGYQYLAIQDPLKVLPQIVRRKPDLIFLDLIMPIVNGYEMCSQIQRVSSLKDIPIIILTSNDSMVDRLRSKIVGASGFLVKPIDEEKVLNKIKCLLSPSPLTSKLSFSVLQSKLKTEINLRRT